MRAPCDARFIRDAKIFECEGALRDLLVRAWANLAARGAGHDGQWRESTVSVRYERK